MLHLFVSQTSIQMSDVWKRLFAPEKAAKSVKFQTCSIATCQVLTNTALYYSNGFQFFPLRMLQIMMTIMYYFAHASVFHFYFTCNHEYVKEVCVKEKPNKNVKFQSCSAAPLRGIKKFTAAQNSSGPTFMCIVLLTRSSAGSRGNGVFPE